MIAIMPRADQVATPGERLVVERETPDDMIQIMQERTLPERVGHIDVYRCMCDEVISMTAKEAHWLVTVLAEMLGAQPVIPGLETLHPDQLRAMHTDLTALVAQEEAKVGAGRSVIVHRALVIRRGEVERAIAVCNARAAQRPADTTASVLSTVVGALGDVMLEMQRRRLLAEGGGPATLREILAAKAATDDMLGRRAADAFEAGAMELVRIGYPGTTAYACSADDLSEEPR